MTSSDPSKGDSTSTHLLFTKTTSTLKTHAIEKMGMTMGSICILIKPNYNIKAVLYFEPEVRNSEFTVEIFQLNFPIWKVGAIAYQQHA